MIDNSVKDMDKEDQPKSRPKQEPGKVDKKENKKDEKKEPKKEKDKKETNAGEEKTKTKEPAMKVVEGYDPWKILSYPHLAEKSMNLVEMENKLIFIVRRDADKHKIKEAVEKGFGVNVLSVNVTITRKGQKKAYIKLHPDYSAADIATRLGMI